MSHRMPWMFCRSSSGDHCKQISWSDCHVFCQSGRDAGQKASSPLPSPSACMASRWLIIQDHCIQNRFLVCWTAICLHHWVNYHASQQSCNAGNPHCPVSYGSDEFKRDVVSPVFCLRGSSHSLSLSLSPRPFLAPVGLHCSKWEPLGVCLDPPFIWITLCNLPISGKSRSHCAHTCICSENRFEMQCRGVQFKGRHTAFIPRMYWHWPVCWADYKEESVHFQTSQELHWSQADAFKCTLAFTVTAVGV